MFRRTWVHWSSFAVVLLLATLSNADDRDYIIPVANNEIKIMSYNVENLFDAIHDNEKNDFEFLPITHPLKAKCKENPRHAKACLEIDWTDQKVELKIAQIKDVIAASGALPDILVLVEVENKAVVGALAKALGYPRFEMTTSPDKRGIDCAILYQTRKLTFVDYYEHEVKKALSLTRNLSAAVFKLDKSLGGEYLAVFANHWPSQGSKTPARTIVVEALKSFADSVRNTYGGREPLVILTGDFNTLEEESPNPISDTLMDPKWSLTLSDVKTLSLEAKNPVFSRMPPATYFYGVDNAWNEFDRFFVSSGLTDGDGLDVDLMSYRVHAPSFVTKTAKGQTVPFRYNHKTDKPEWLGYSDHFGIVVKLKYN